MYSEIQSYVIKILMFGTQVCECLGINKECDYFGLQYKTVKGQDVWLNLRNLIEHQVAGVHPYRFALRVKFWVPPHLLLQESTR